MFEIPELSTMKCNTDTNDFSSHKVALRIRFLTALLGEKICFLNSSSN